MDGAVWQRVGLILQIVGIILAGVEVWGKDTADWAEEKFVTFVSNAVDRSWVSRVAGLVVATPLAISMLVLVMFYVYPADSIGKRWLENTTQTGVREILTIVPPDMFAWVIIVFVLWTAAGSLLGLVLTLGLKERTPWTASSHAARWVRRRSLRLALIAFLRGVIATFNTYWLIIDWVAKSVAAVSFALAWLVLHGMRRFDAMVKRTTIPRTVPVIGFLVVIAGIACQLIGTF